MGMLVPSPPGRSIPGLLGLVATVWIGSPAGAAAPRLIQPIRLSVEQESRTSTYGPFKGIATQSTVFRIHRPDHPAYQIHYRRHAKPVVRDGREVVGDNDTGLGLWIPWGPCWYGNNTIEVKVDGRLVTREVEARYLHTCNRQRALIGFSWDTRDATVTMVLHVSAKGRPVRFDIDVRPKRAVRSIQLRLVCYPGSAADVPRLGSERWCLTASGTEATARSTVGRGKHIWPKPKMIPLQRPADAWVFYADRLMDRQQPPHGGPCALVMGTGIDAGRVRVCGYEILTRLDLPNKGGRARLAVVELPRLRNQAGLKWVRDHAAGLAESLTRTDFDLVAACRADRASVLTVCRDRLPKLPPGCSPALARRHARCCKQLHRLEAMLAQKMLRYADLHTVHQEAIVLREEVTKLALDIWAKR